MTMAAQTLVEKKLQGKIVSKALRIASKDANTGTITIKGFASICGEDRHGDEIDVKLFDIDTFMKNPVAFYDHKSWKRKGSDNGVNIGLIRELYAVTVKTSEVEDAFDLIDMRSGNVIDTIKNDEGFLAKVGDTGLWCVMEVTEPEVVELVEQNRVNTFSWRGLMYSKQDGTPVSIDLHEISVVNIPANKRSLFSIAKALDEIGDSLVIVSCDGRDAYIVDESITQIKDDDEPRYGVIVRRANNNAYDGYPDIQFFSSSIVRTREEAIAIAQALTGTNITEKAIVILEPTGNKTTYGDKIYRVIVDTELVIEKSKSSSLLARLVDIAKGVTLSRIPTDSDDEGRDVRNVATETEGGEEEMKPEELELLKSTNTLLNDVAKAQKDLLEGQTKMAERIDAIEKAKAKASDPNDDDADDASAAEGDDDSASKSKAKTETNTDDDDGEIKKMLTGIKDSLSEITLAQKTLADNGEKMNARITKMEKTALPSHALDDEDEIEAAKHVAQEIQKAYANLSPEEKKLVKRNGLAKRMVIPIASS